MAVETVYEFHEAANIFPLDDENIDSLAADIGEHGLQVPIELLDDRIVDGRRRYLACRLANVDPNFREVSVDDPVAYVLSLNLHRRHLSETQRGMIAARAAGLYEERAKERMVAGGKEAGVGRPKGVANLPHPISGAGKSRDQVGQLMGVSGKTVSHGKKVLTSGTPALIAAVDADKIAVSTAAKVALLPPERQDEFVENAKGKPASRKERVDEPLAEEPIETPAHELPRGEKEASEIRDEFAERLAKVSDGGVYTLANLTAAFGVKDDRAALIFIRQCEVSPAVKVHRNYGRKGLVQYSFEATRCVNAQTRVRQLAEQILTDPAVSGRAHAAAKQILSLIGG